MAITSVNVPLVKAAYDRPYAGGVALRLLNRFFEEDPIAQEGFASVARPGTESIIRIGAGPVIRATFTQEGVFGDDLFVISGDTLYRVNSALSVQMITGAVSFAATYPSIAVQASPGVERLWVADGDKLSYYEGAARAQAVLVATGAIAAGDVVRIDSVYYTWVNSGVDAGSPAGTLTNPWRVLLGATTEGSLANLAAAIDNSGTPGSTYSTALVEHPTVESRRARPDRLFVQAKIPGPGGNSIVVSETGAGIEWRKLDNTAATTLANGGEHFLTPVELPEGSNDAKALAVASVSGFIVVAAANSQRLFFVLPGEFWVDTFAEAEAEPDKLVDVKAVGDILWVLGTSTIEQWSATGDAVTPFAPIQGQALRFGAIRDTVVVQDGRIFYADTTGIVRDGSGNRLSTHYVEEKIRLRG